MRNQAETITEIKSAVNFFLPGSEVIMFGSRARGEASPGSDFDILIIALELIDDRQRLDMQARIRKSLAQNSILADILVQTRHDIEKKRILPGHIVRSAMKEGIRI